jgi:hypothetical protein
VDTDDAQARKDARWGRYQAESRRTQAKVWLALTPLWIAVAMVRWFDGDADELSRWLLTGVALLYLGAGFLQWRVLRRPLPPVPEKHEAPDR